MGLTSLIVTFLVFWFALYATVYWYYFSTSVALSETEVVEEPTADIAERTVQIDIESNPFPTNLFENPFVSSSCKLTFESKTDIKGSVAVVVPVRNERKSNLHITIQSVIQNSGSLLHKIVLVDNDSDERVSEWEDVLAISSKIQVIRLNKMVGLSAARNAGARSLSGTTGVDDLTIVFLSSRSVVSANWLTPLLHNTAANTVTYPAIDVWDARLSSFIPSDDAVAGFTWSMAFRWEQKNNNPRILSSSSTSGDSTGSVHKDKPVYSPAVPGILAMKYSFYMEMNGFDESIDTAVRVIKKDTTVGGAGGVHTIYWTHEEITDPSMIEFSLRVWLCGGVIIQVPCSRVAHQYQSVFEHGVAVGTGVTQHAVDHAVLKIGEYWFPVEYREIIHQARFVNRIPHTVHDITSAAGSPDSTYGMRRYATESCQEIDWFLTEIYPGLQSDATAIQAHFQHRLLHTNVIANNLNPLIQQYHKESNLGQINHNEVERLKKLAIEDRRSGRRGFVNDYSGSVGLAVAVKAKEMTMEEKQLLSDSSHENHANYVQEALACEDQPRTWEKDDCSVLANEQKSCKSNPGYMMFGCPKSCNLCDVNGKLCTDFFLMKCPIWAKEGQCTSNADEMLVKCRHSCGHCVRPDDGDGKAAAAVILPPASPVVVVRNDVEQQDRVDPYTAQRQWSDGLLPDPLIQANVNTQCEMNRKPNGDLLDRVHVDAIDSLAALQGKPFPRIFCGIYTMESKHTNNVQATKETWGKKCTGFVAFSTATDPTIPSLAIKHEGIEDYNNMWQKSRSIWKYIAQHYHDDFDYFLMGGDDMFYIMENLYYYLGSDEIQKASQSSSHGLFLGRRFFPPKQNVFNSGGAGYLLDKTALGILAKNIDLQHCFPHQVGFWEDVNIANCLRVSTQASPRGSDTSNALLPYDTRDTQGRERFHPFTPGQHLTYGVDHFDKNDWYVKYNPELKLGVDCCSDRSISFHYIGADLMRKLHAYVYHCPKKMK